MVYDMKCYVTTEDAEGQHVLFTVLALRCSESKTPATLFLFLLRQLHQIIKVSLILDLMGIGVFVHPIHEVFRTMNIA